MDDLVIYGLGELGRLFAGGAARANRRVTPIVRGSEPATVLATVPAGTPVFVCVSENDLAGAVSAVPEAARGDLVLLQNELFPDVWLGLGMRPPRQPTVMVPWILKKKGLPTRIVRPTPVWGPHAAVVADVHRALEMPCETLPDERALARALAAKYSFILVVNALGALENKTMGTWLASAPAAAQAIARDALALASTRLGTVDEAAAWWAAIWGEIERGMTVLGDVPSAGRTARARVDGAIALGARLGVATPALAAVAAGRLPG